LDYLWRIASYAFASELLPARLRVAMMRWSGCKLSPGVCIWGSGLFVYKNFSVAEGSFINRNFYFDGSDRLTIGRSVHIGAFVRVITGSHEIDANPAFRCGKHRTAPVTIADGCWIGTGATILQGVTITRGCVIGAGSVVTKTTEPNGLYMGIPAKRIRELPP
jgi:maltose O-acetyltransferase